LKFSSFSILIIFILLMIVGASLLPLLNVQLTPSRSLPGMSVSYRWPDASARVIEQEVTAKLEGLFSSVKGIKGVSSVSSKGSGRINLSFKKTVNLDAARFEVASLIRRAYSDLQEQIAFPEQSMGTFGRTIDPYFINFKLKWVTVSILTIRYWGFVPEENIVGKAFIIHIFK
jgi:multidrug efflux pump subunit AcrB